jgi:hypothetical protein
MNYGYECKGWSQPLKQRLANRLTQLCDEPRPYHDHLQVNREPDYEMAVAQSKPYVEVDDTYPGVRIRRITHLSRKERAQLIAEADKIYAIFEKAHQADQEASHA